MRRFVPFLVLALVSATVPGPARAQRVFGRVVEADGRTGIAGAVVTLVHDSVRATPVLSGADGRYALRAPEPGRWQVRADAIGRPAQQSRVLTLGANDTTRVDLRFAPYVPSLSMVRATADRSCVQRPDEVERTAEVWQAIRTALEASTATERERRTPLELEVTDYRLDVFKQRTAAMKLTLRSWSGAGFLSAPPEELVVKGYVRQVGDSVAYFAPDASVITSPSFLATHCFRVEERAPFLGARQVGVSFQPLPDRVVGDVRGTLWLDAATSALRKLELEYVVPGRTSSLPNADATMEFSRLPNGRWFVSRWMLNMPVVREVGPALGGVSSVEFSGWRSREGLARAISLRDAQRMAPPAVVMGRAIDSTTGQPMVGATVTLEGVGQVATDSLGAFAFTVRDPLAVPAPANLVLTSPRLAALKLESLTREVTVVAGDTNRTVLATPGPGQVQRSLCSAASASRAGEGVVVGDVSAPEDVLQHENVDIEALWWDDAAAINMSEMQLRQLGRPANIPYVVSTRLAPSDRGHFVLCGVPTDAPVRLIASRRKQRPLTMVLPAGRGVLTEVRFSVPPDTTKTP